jgi:hypothetical protein
MVPESLRWASSMEFFLSVQELDSGAAGHAQQSILMFT